MTARHRLSTIGYELATPDRFVATLLAAGVEVLVDVRAVASSRRPGFAKTRLAASVEQEGIQYLHLRGLGTPAEGRAAAKAGRPAEMLHIFREHLETPEAIADLARLEELVRSGRHSCILCLEADPTHCHRSEVAAVLSARLPLRVEHLDPSG